MSQAWNDGHTGTAVLHAARSSQRIHAQFEARIRQDDRHAHWLLLDIKRHSVGRGPFPSENLQACLLNDVRVVGRVGSKLWLRIPDFMYLALIGLLLDE